MSFSCNIKPPPSQVKSIHQQIISLIRRIFALSHDELDDGPGAGPTLVTVVNASRVQADIDRDIAAAKLTSKQFKRVQEVVIIE